MIAAYGSAFLDRLTEELGTGPLYERKLPEGLLPLVTLFKELGLYVDVAGGQFVSPAEFGAENREWAEWLLGFAKERLASMAAMHETEERSVAVARKSGKFLRAILEHWEEPDVVEQLRDVIRRASGEGAGRMKSGE